MLSTSLASVMRRRRRRRRSDCRQVKPPSEKMCTVQHQPYIPQGTEAIPNCTFPRAPKQSPGCDAPGHRAQNRRRGWGDLA